MPDSTLLDPLGRSITLHDRTWFAHVLKRHPEMRPHRRTAEQAITRPLEIRVSLSDPDCRTYYGPTLRPAIIIAVVADVRLRLVKTAFLTAKMKGPFEWSPPTP